MNQVFITTGDRDGIGAEVTFKALNSSSKSGTFFIFSTKKDAKKYFQKPSKTFPSLKEALNCGTGKFRIIDDGKSPRSWITQAALTCAKNKKSCLVTAPLSKNRVGEGHTEIFKKIFPRQNIQMTFWGKKFHMILGTTHIPVAKVSKSLSRPLVIESFAKATELLELSRNKSRRIGILGLNPHSGENGAISKQDSRIFRWIKSESNKEKYRQFNVEYLVPDAAFVNPQRLCDAYVAWYHDQGLIPFKMVHGHSHGIQVTLGLPFIRTSVDHGTAKDIYGKNLADHRSMKLAIEKAIQFT